MNAAGDARVLPARFKRPRVLVMLLVVCAVAAALPAAGVSDARRPNPLRKLSVDLACVVSFQFDFSPRLNYNTVTSKTTAQLTACGSPNGQFPSLKSATLFADRGDATATGCAPAPLIARGVASILWNDDSTSTLNFRISTNPRGTGIELGGLVTSGRMTGSRIIAGPVLITQSGFCGLGGVKSFTASLGTDTFVH